jgi:uncharacterized tellurite resistance protein B-like protein
MAAAVASADSVFAETEADVILDHINNGAQIPEVEHRRLAARLYLYRTAPPSISGLKRRVEVINQETREAIADFLLTVALADGIVDPGEVKTLERLYHLMELDRSALYSKLHNMEARPVSEQAGGSHAATVPSRGFKEGAIQLDRAKIAALRADSAKVSALLGNVFASPAHDEPEELPEAEAPENRESSLLGLDRKHSILLQVLLRRAEWNRDELEELCSDRGLMLDGAIERINEAAFNQFDKAIIEGGDPMEVNCDLLQGAMV